MSTDYSVLPSFPPSAEVSKTKSAYSQGVKVKGNSLIFISGQVPADKRGNLLGKGDIKEQTKQLFENLKTMLKVGGATLQDIVNLTIFLKNMEDFPAFTEVRSQHSLEYFPVTSLVAVDSLVNKDWLIGIEAIAVIDSMRIFKALGW